MIDDGDHSACVGSFMERATQGASAERLLEVFEQGFDAVWRRAHRTLGDVTLTAIVDRVLHSAAEQFPIFAALEIQPSGVPWPELRERARGLPQRQLEQALQFALVEVLTVLGTLTADILTPALHAELSKLGRERAEPSEHGLHARAPHSESNDGEGAN